MKKALAIVFSLILIIASLPLSASANDAVYYLDENGNLQSVTDYTVVTHNNNNTPVTWTNGWYVVNENTQINGRITVSGIVHLIILDGVLFNVTGGIEVDEGNFFFVYGQGLSNGVLGATSSGNYAPAIGSTSSNDDPVNYGTIVINGCTVNAICTSGYWAAAIGSGEGASGGDNIIINAGSVTATAATSSSGAGIGGGNKSSGGNITINGGTVNATSGNNGGAGIGGGGGDCGESGNITINGGTVTAVSTSSYGANIGSGGYAAVNSITINGGTVTAVSEKYGSGIGTGYSGKGGTIRITDGDITASSKGTGIGGGGNAGEIDSVTITGGKVSAASTGTNSCPGIGGHSSAMVINISGGEVTAVGGDYGAGIGGSWTSGSSGECTGGTITISGGVVNATGGKMATAIGAGYASDCKEINFNGGQITATSGQNGYGVGGSQYKTADGRINFNLANASDFVLSDNYMCDNISFAYTHYIDNTQTVATADNITGNKVVKDATVSTIHYVGADGSDKTQTGFNTIVTSTAAQTWTSGWYVVSRNVELNKRVTVSGTVNLILCDGAVFNPKKGITVNEGNTLNIYCQSAGDGALTVDNCDGYMAAIGSNSGSTSTGVNCGTITINGGIITANGPQYYGTGIGGAVKGTGGTITVNGGTVTATGGSSSAGIGGSSETSGNITINGGTVTATGGSNSAGIGGGSYKDADTITINGGTVTATGGTSGAGIGGGAAHGYTAITITGGNITANGGATNATSGVPAAGIGAGYRTSSSNAVNFGPLTLGWKTEDDSITASSISAESLVYDRDFCFVSDGVYYKALSDNTAGQTLLPIIFGDVNADGLIELADYTLIKQMLSGENVTVSGKNLLAADIEYDTAVDAFDLFRIDRKLNGLISWAANPAYVMENSGHICTINGREYYKVNPGKALCAVYCYKGYSGPLLVSTDSNAVTYNSSYDSGSYFTDDGSFEYLGLTWYYSATIYFWAGNHPANGYAPKLDGEYAYQEDAARALIDVAGVTVF